MLERDFSFDPWLGHLFVFASSYLLCRCLRGGRSDGKGREQFLLSDDPMSNRLHVQWGRTDRTGILSILQLSSVRNMGLALFGNDTVVADMRS